MNSKRMEDSPQTSFLSKATCNFSCLEGNDPFSNGVHHRISVGRVETDYWERWLHSPFMSLV